MFNWRRRKQTDTRMEREFRQTIQDCRNAEAKINQVTDDKMIEAAIYESQAARLRVGYLLDLMRPQKDMAAAQ